MEALRFWLDLGIDGFRLDAVPYLFEREGTDCENLPRDPRLPASGSRKEVDPLYPGQVLLAEANQWPEDVVEYFGDRVGGDECHMASTSRSCRACSWPSGASSATRSPRSWPDPGHPRGLPVGDLPAQPRRADAGDGHRRGARLHVRRVRQGPADEGATSGSGGGWPRCWTTTAAARAVHRAAAVACPARRCCTTATRSAWATTSGWATATACAPRCSGRPTATAGSPTPTPASSTCRRSWTRLRLPGAQRGGAAAQPDLAAALDQADARGPQAAPGLRRADFDELGVLAIPAVLAFVRGRPEDPSRTARTGAVREQPVPLPAAGGARPAPLRGRTARWSCSAARTSPGSASSLPAHPRRSRLLLVPAAAPGRNRRPGTVSPRARSCPRLTRCRWYVYRMAARQRGKAVHGVRRRAGCVAGQAAVVPARADRPRPRGVADTEVVPGDPGLRHLLVPSVARRDLTATSWSWPARPGRPHRLPARPDRVGTTAAVVRRAARPRPDPDAAGRDRGRPGVGALLSQIPGATSGPPGGPPGGPPRRPAAWTAWCCPASSPTPAWSSATRPSSRCSAGSPGPEPGGGGRRRRWPGSARRTRRAVRLGRVPLDGAPRLAYLVARSCARASDGWSLATASVRDLFVEADLARRRGGRRLRRRGRTAGRGDRRRSTADLAEAFGDHVARAPTPPRDGRADVPALRRPSRRSPRWAA